MLSNSFLHLPGIGAITERRLWGRGVLTWEDFLGNESATGLSPRSVARTAENVQRSVARLHRDDHAFFASGLPGREHWRAYPEFAHRIAYLDIETTGLESADDITMIGLYDGRDIRIYTKGEDLEQFEEDVGRFGLLVTFFGACFDLPFLRRRFPSLSFDQLHVDLCYSLRRLGLSGGLKNIERRLSIRRSPETEHLDGWDAVRLWREWERGSRDALDLLKAYNREDIVNLEILMRYAYGHLREESGFPE